jgi:hypothetical protein
VILEHAGQFNCSAINNPGRLSSCDSRPEEICFTT